MEQENKQAKRSMASRALSFGQWALAISVIYLGYTIHGFTQKVGEIIEVYPQVITEVNEVADKLQIEEWLEYSARIEVLVPQVLDTVNKVQQTAEQIGVTAASIDTKIPLVLSEVTSIRTEMVPSIVKEVEQVRRTVPTIVKEAQHYRTDVIPPVLAETKAIRTTTIPNVITESEHLRRDVPPMLAKADNIVENSQDIVQQATQSALEGTVKGVVTVPINLIREAGNGVKNRVITDEK